MNERVLIYAGLAVFLVMVSLPFWLRDDDPELRPPALSIKRQELNVSNQPPT